MRAADGEQRVVRVQAEVEQQNGDAGGNDVGMVERLGEVVDVAPVDVGKWVACDENKFTALFTHAECKHATHISIDFSN